jgi:predicted outer membrane repeat protein
MAVLLLALLLPIFVPSARVARALGPIVVNTADGRLDDLDNGKCTLLEAVQAANTDVAVRGCSAGSGTVPDLITFSVPGVIKLKQTANINSNIAMLGPVAISGDGANRIFQVNTDGTLSISLMTLQDGKTGGGAAVTVSGGTLNVAAVSFENNEADTSNGGAILNSSGTVRIAASSFIGNKSAGDGGAIASTGGYGSLTVAASNFNGNVATGSGGAIYNSGKDTMISDVIIAGNIAKVDDVTKGGGGLANDQNGTVTVIRSSFAGNLSPSGSGGGIFNNIQTTMVISDTSFNGNLAGTPPTTETRGGGIYNMAVMTIYSSSLLNNGVVGDGGGVANDRGGVLKIYNTSFTANAASKRGGGIFNFNTADGGGGGIYPKVTAVNTTLSSNAVLLNNGVDNGGGIYNGNIYTAATFSNSIIDSNVGGNCSQGLNTLGHNLSSEPLANTTSCNLIAPGDINNADPKLKFPFYNGGPIAGFLTQEPAEGSAAIDAGDPAICAASPINNLDQRGEPRPKNGDGVGGPVCDIGAYEADDLAAGYGSDPTPNSSVPFGNVFLGQSANASLKIFETGNTKLKVSNPVFSGGNPGDFSVAAGQLPLEILDDGAAKTLTLTCTPGAATPRGTTLSLTTNDPSKPTVSYNLTCAGVQQPTTGFGSDPVAPGPFNVGESFVNVATSANIKIIETGTKELKVDQLVLGGANAGDFSVPAAFTLTVADGAPAGNLPVTCKPTALGIRTATLTMHTTDLGKPTVSFNLTCTGIPTPPPYLVPGGNYTGGGVVPLTNPYGVAVSPDGKFVYATGATSDSVAVYSRNQTSGALTLVQSLTLPELDGARGVTVSPDGKSVYVAAAAADAVVAFKRDSASGFVTKIDVVKDGDSYFCNNQACPLNGLDGAYNVKVSPDSRYLYITGATDDSIVVLFRDLTTGRIASVFGVQYVETITDATDLNDVRGLALSPDGAYLYAAVYGANNLMVYSRNISGGKLTLLEKHTQGDTGSPLGTLDGLNGPFQVAVSPDNASVYVVSTTNAAVAAFSRSTTGGELTWIGTQKDGVNGVTGLSNGSGITVAPDGKHVYATGYAGKSTVVFERKLDTGALSYLQSVTRAPFTGAGGNPPLDGAREIATSPDGKNVYVAAYVDNRVVRLDVANPIPLIESITPSSVTVLGPDFTVNIYGKDFMPSSKVFVDNALNPRTTTFINSSHVQAVIKAGDITTVSTREIYVQNPGPGGGDSNKVRLAVIAANTNPVPAITQLQPNGVQAGSAAFTLDVYGTGFIASSKVQWNGAERPTTFVSATHVQASISAADVQAAGLAGVTVVNPAPGGGPSNAATFTIASADENPRPTITEISPTQVSSVLGTLPDSFTLHVYGHNFINESQINWNGSPRSTTFISSEHLTMVVTSGDAAINGIADITVVNPEPGGGTSNGAAFKTVVIAASSRAFIPLMRR